jgi:hypothetical protein
MKLLIRLLPLFLITLSAACRGTNPRVPRQDNQATAGRAVETAPKGWSKVPSGTTFDLAGIWGSGSADVWAVGGTFHEDSATERLILHWDGRSWSAAENVPEEDFLSEIWGIAADDVWAVGMYGGMLHWNGKAWSAVPSGTDNDLSAVWGSSKDDVWASDAVYPILLHWNGTAWSEEGNGAVGGSGIWGSGPDDVYAVNGYSGNAYHWDGKTWSMLDIPIQGELIPHDAWETGPSDVWFAGESIENESSHKAMILHWDGKAWSVSYMSDEHASFLTAIWGSGPDDIFTCGGAGTILHWNGAAWTREETGTTVRLEDIRGTPEGEVWAVGVEGTILRRIPH